MRWLMALLALAMVLGPTLGQMHRAVHAGTAQSQSHAGHQARVAAASESTSQNTSSTCATDPLLGASWVQALFAGHGPAECQLLDQAHHGLAGPPSAIAFVAPVPAAVQLVVFAAVPHTIFLAAPPGARGPPSHFSS
ncbi:hypothetical protein KUF54_07050 [Comamonas sp. Y33R10-2]|nr:hypothetical protein KUF54_07050 [Comamonas sp. Y33R10-2]